jgi:hypothetical protein
MLMERQCSPVLNNNLFVLLLFNIGSRWLSIKYFGYSVWCNIFSPVQFNDSSLYSFILSENQIKKTALPFHNYSNMNEDFNVNKEIVFRYPSKNMSLEDERSQLHSRNKRFLSYPRYVEVMVTADAKMVHHHGQNLQHYVLTLMSIVSNLL